MAQDDFIQSAFKELHLRSAEDAGGFHVSSMNECLDKARSLPPLVTLYPNVVLEGDLCVIFGQSESARPSSPCRWRGILLPVADECCMPILR